MLVNDSLDKMYSYYQAKAMTTAYGTFLQSLILEHSDLLWSWHSLGFFIITWCIILWFSNTQYSASALMLVDKVTSSLHVHFIGVPSILCTERRSYITLQKFCENYWKGCLRERKWCTISRTSIKVHSSDEEIKEDKHHKVMHSCHNWITKQCSLIIIQDKWVRWQFSTLVYFYS